MEDFTKSPSKIKSPPHYNEPPTKKLAPAKNVLNLNGQKCLVCNEEAEGQPSVICQACGDLYHCKCHNPRVGKTTRKSTWKCAPCKEKENDAHASEESEGTKDESEKIPVSESLITTKEKSLPKTTKEHDKDDLSRRTSTVSLSSLPSEEEKDLNGLNENVQTATNNKVNGVHEDDLIEDNTTGFKFNLQKAKQLLKTSANNNPNFDSVPDCSNWSCQQIFDHFNSFFPKEAYIFKEQEIDGTSLLLMTRSDIFKFNLKLGPALNIYRHVVMLQTRSYDPRNTWK